MMMKTLGIISICVAARFAVDDGFCNETRIYHSYSIKIAIQMVQSAWLHMLIIHASICAMFVSFDGGTKTHQPTN